MPRRLFWYYVLGGSALIMLLASLENPQSVVGRLVGLTLFGAASFGLGVYLWITYDAIRHPNAFINYLHAQSYFAQRKYEQALAHFDRATRMNPLFSKAYQEKAMTLIALRQPETALAAITDAIQLKPHDVSSYGMRAWLLLSMEQFERAIADYTEVIRSNPDRKSVV